MDRNEKIFLGVVFAAIIAVLIFKVVPTVAAEPSLSVNPNDIPRPDGPDYLMYNVPWGYSPPVQNVMPNLTAGQVGAQSGQGAYNYDCGCGGSNAVH